MACDARGGEEVNVLARALTLAIESASEPPPGAVPNEAKESNVQVNYLIIYHLLLLTKMRHGRLTVVHFRLTYR